MWDIIHLFLRESNPFSTVGGRKLREPGWGCPRSVLLQLWVRLAVDSQLRTQLTSDYPDAPSSSPFLEAVLTSRHLRTTVPSGRIPAWDTALQAKERKTQGHPSKLTVREAFLSFLKLRKRILKRVNLDLFFFHHVGKQVFFKTGWF